jgi:hypothetical protein
MTTRTAPVAAPQAAARAKLTEQFTFLTDEATAQYIEGAARLAAGDARPKTGEVIRDLIAEALVARYGDDTDAYARAVRAGRRELAQKAKPAA